MHLKSKKVQACFLFVLSMLPVLIIICFIIKQQFVRLRMEDKLEKEHLTTLTISSRCIKWHKPDEEIIINGHFFDVRNVEEISPGVLQVMGLYDWQEQALYADFEDLMDDEEEKPGKKQQAFIKWMTSLYDNDLNPMKLSSLYLTKGQVSSTTITPITSRPLQIELPPPRI